MTLTVGQAALEWRPSVGNYPAPESVLSEDWKDLSGSTQNNLISSAFLRHLTGLRYYSCVVTGNLRYLSC